MEWKHNLSYDYISGQSMGIERGIIKFKLQTHGQTIGGWNRSAGNWPCSLKTINIIEFHVTDHLLELDGEAACVGTWNSPERRTFHKGSPVSLKNLSERIEGSTYDEYQI